MAVTFGFGVGSASDDLDGLAVYGAKYASRYLLCRDSDDELGQRREQCRWSAAFTSIEKKIEGLLLFRLTD